MAEFFKLQIEASNLQRKMYIIVDKSKDLGPPLRVFGQYLREKAKKKFDQQGPGWAPLKEETIKGHFGKGRLTVHGKVKVGAAKNLKRLLEKQIKAGKASVAARSELNRVIRNQISGDEAAMKVFGHFASKIEDTKLVANLKKDIAKAGKKTVSQKKEAFAKAKSKAKRKILGKLSSSITASVSKNVLVVSSRVPWAGAHNKGATVGHGSVIPKRTFLELDDEDTRVLADLLSGHLVEDLG